MGRTINQWLSEYGESHQNPVNKLVHWICVPTIMFSLMGLLSCIPVPGHLPWYCNWASLALVLALLFYLRLSLAMFLGFCLVSVGILAGIRLVQVLHFPQLLLYSGLFVAAWLGQFWGHHVEGKKPSFFKDLQFLLIGPAWLMHFVFEKAGIRYS